MDIFNKTPEGQLSKKQLDKKHSDVISFLDEHYAYFVTYVLRLGKPEWTNKIPTAAVDCSDTIDRRGEFDPDNFRFIFNPMFATQLPLKEMAFVEAHETMHVLLNHLRLVENFVDRDTMRKIMEQQKKGERPNKDEIKAQLTVKRDMMLFNIAADCVINDYLVSCGLEAVTTVPLCTGEEWIGESAAYMTVTEVFYKIKQKQNKGNDGDSDDSDGEGDGEGSGSGSGQPGDGEAGGSGKLVKADGSEGEYTPLDDHSWMIGDDDDIEEAADALDKLYEKMEQDGKNDPGLDDKKTEEANKQTQAQQDIQNSMRAGTEDGNMAEFMEQVGVELAWAKLMKEIDPDIFKEPGIAPPMISSFHARRRKLADPRYKRINLPVYRKEERTEKESKEIKSIVLALDVSGSIGPKDANRFMTLAKSIPTNRIKLFCCTFNSSYQTFDPQTQTNVSVGGGTDFEAINNFIAEKVRPELKGQYPKSVVVITDGEAPIRTQPSEDEAKGWFWLISPVDRAGSYYPASKTIGRRAKLEEYIV